MDSKKDVTVITYGTFDMFHIGHLNLINRLSELGGRLIVAVSTDEFNREKGKRNLMPYEQRAAIVGSIKNVDFVIPEESWAQKRSDINKYGVDVFAIGDDWKGQFDFLSDICRVVYLERTKDISTTELKKSLKNFLSIPHEDLIKAFEVLQMLKQDLE
ncbi:adenylyltransferase/cytidyltransferase family protein [Halomonas heilongjiangensis]|uniref:Glycerol-3-phosphate cytidylyltransferase n=1 Tax=Halomonas heilongjiangensis TaxID=1387883 RepID=A0A2N7TUK9_9GAMM|nr:glycerol-3-phosphate cytidylyltransferase [Halomonas heilongjiangensis]PXX87670.1 glycerol-3-phosphate cytidylyltransferase [Halomonas heilongjiangensis]